MNLVVFVCGAVLHADTAQLADAFFVIRTISRPNSLENCGFGVKNKTQSFQNLFSGDIFLHLLNIFATADPKLKQKIPKIIVQF